MSAVKATSNGSKGFNTQAPALAHLLSHGVSGEVENLYKALYAVLGLQCNQTVDEWSGPGAGATLQLSYTPHLRMGAALVLQEIVDGAAVSPPTGTLALVGSAWIYTPATAVNASTAAVATGTADCSAAALYGATGTLNGLTLILTVNGHAKTLTFHSPTNPTAPPQNTQLPPGAPYQADSLLQEIMAVFPDVIATLNGSNHLVLTNKFLGATQLLVVGAGTANTALGLTAASHAGTGHSYAIVYEVDVTSVPAAAATVAGGTYAGGPGTGSPTQP